MAEGRWLYGDRAANFGLLNTFDLGSIETLYAFYGKTFGCVNLELWGRKQTLQPGESASLRLAYEYIPDLKAFLGRPR